MNNQASSNKVQDFVLEPIESQCLPYACHYDDHTILTKNGELLQVIKLEGYSLEKLQNVEEIDLRAIIRQSILEKVENSKVSFWFHTLRRKRNLDSINYFSWTFAKDNHESWVKKNHWRDKYVNELYITILYEGESLNDQKNFTLSFIPKALKKYHLVKLSENSKKLDQIVNQMLDILGSYGGKRLSVQHDDLGVHSEILEFLSKTVCLKGKRVPLPIQNIENVFANTFVVFGGNIIQIVDNNEKKFAALFSIKEYQEFASKALDKFMQIATEYIVSQTLNFVDNEIVKKEFDNLNYILGVSKDEKLKVGCGLAQILESDRKKCTDYGSQQMTIMLIADSPDDLQKATTSFSKEIAKLGMVVVREDLHIALSYWSLLPGNFHFFKRTSYINTSRSASFVSLHNTPTGKMQNSWGAATTIFRKVNGSPHFFNLHVNNCGHTIVIGPENSDKTLFTNFILSECTKYEPRILYLDQNNTSLVTVKAIGGRYETLQVTGEKPSYMMNPLILKENDENFEFLSKWLFLMCSSGETEDLELQNIIDKALLDLMQNVPLKSRKISRLIEYIEKHKLNIIYEFSDNKPEKNEIILYLNKDERLIALMQDIEPFPVEGNDDASKGIPTALLRKIIIELKKKSPSEGFTISFEEERQIINFLALRTNRLNAQEKIITSLSKWIAPGKYAFLFDNDYDEFDAGTKAVGLSFKDLINKDNSQIISPLVFYILHKFKTSLDGTPTILVINDANLLLDNQIFVNYLPSFFDYLTGKNAIVIFNCDAKFEIKTHIKNAIDKFPTKIFLPYLSPSVYKESFGLTDKEVNMIKGMKSLYRNFMIKQESENIIAELNLDGLENTILSLTGKKKAIDAVEKAILETKTTNPNRWISNYYKFLNEKTD